MRNGWMWMFGALMLTNTAEARSHQEILYRKQGTWRMAWIDGTHRTRLWEAVHGKMAWHVAQRHSAEPLRGLSAGRDGMVAYTRRCVLRWGLKAWKMPRCVAGFNEEIIDLVWTDLDGDGVQGIVVMIQTPRGDGRLVGIDAQTGRWMRLQIERIRGPWALDSADVDGDGREELLIGMFRPAYFDRVVRRRLWIYTYLPKQAALFPTWRGSRFSRPWLDFVPITVHNLRMEPSVAPHGWMSATRDHPTTRPTTSPFARASSRPSEISQKRLLTHPTEGAPSSPSHRTKPATAWLAVLEAAKGYPQRVMLYRWQSFGFVGEEYAPLTGSWHSMRVFCLPHAHCVLWMLPQTNAPSVSSSSATSAKRLSFLAALLSRASQQKHR